MVKRKNNNRFNLLFTGLILVVIFSVAGFYTYKRLHKPTSTAKDQTTSTAPSAQENFTSNNDRQVATTSENKGSAGVTDTQGQTSVVTDKSQWTTSKTGEITTYSPAKNALLIKGDTLSGESTLSIVYYRVLDDVSGMITQGQLSVVNGKFSGSIVFNTTASGGRLDVYGTTDSGKEFGNVEIPVRFKQP